MTPSLLLVAGLVIAAEPEKRTLPVRMISLATDPAHVRPDGQRLYISGFHASKLCAVTSDGRKPLRELSLDAYETYRKPDNGQELRTIQTAAGGDLALARGKIFVGQVFQGSLLVVDQETLTPVKRLPLGGEGCLTATSDGRTVYFASNKQD